MKLTKIIFTIEITVRDSKHGAFFIGLFIYTKCKFEGET